MPLARQGSAALRRGRYGSWRGPHQSRRAERDVLELTMQCHTYPLAISRTLCRQLSRAHSVEMAMVSDLLASLVGVRLL